MMHIEQNKNKYYEAQGFVEALVAILITGLAAVALMTVTARTIGDVVRNEKQDQLTQEAVKGASMIRYIVGEWNYGRRDLLPSTSVFLQQGSTFTQGISLCFSLDGSIQDPDIQEILNCDHSQEGIRPDLCLTNWDSVKVDDYDFEGVSSDGMFRIVCIDGQSDTSGYVMIARIYTGFRSCDAVSDVTRSLNDRTNSCSMYEHTAVYTVEP